MEVDEAWTVEQLATQCPPPGWLSVFREAKPELALCSTVLKRREAQEGKCYPLRRDLFAAFHLTPLSETRVVIVGQDPYPQTTASGEPLAMGLSFSVRETEPVPVSLKNVFRELERTIPGWENPGHGNLTHWAKQGVLLLNMCLTVKPGEPGSHAGKGKKKTGNFWKGFLHTVVRNLVEHRPNCVFVLWGRDAQEGVGEMLPESAHVITGYHPAARGSPGFAGCDHFNRVNAKLVELGESPIQW